MRGGAVSWTSFIRWVKKKKARIPAVDRVENGMERSSFTGGVTPKELLGQHKR